MTDIITGSAILKDALRIRNRKMNLAGLARDLGLGVTHLEEFIDGKRTLPDATMQALCTELFPMSTFDPKLDVLKPALVEPARPMLPPLPLDGVVLQPPLPPGAAQHPQTIDLVPVSVPGKKQVAGEPKQTSVQLEPVTEKPRPKRAGWTGSWL